MDFKNDEIHFREFIHIADTNHYKIDEKGKTDKAPRTIPLLPPVKKVLKGKHGMLITNADGTPLTIQGARQAWASYVTCMEKAINGVSKRWYGRRKEDKGKELPEWQSFTVLPYDLRHTFITWGRDNGVELHTMIEWCGHSDAQMILKIYDEVTSDRSKAEAAKLIKKPLGPKTLVGKRQIEGKHK